MILFTLLWILYSISEAYEDSEYSVIYNHKPTVYPRLITGAICMYTWQGLTEYGWLSIKMLSFPLLLASVFWFVFELSRNLFKGNYFYYVGSTATSDRWLKRYELPIFFVRMWLVALAYCLYYYFELAATANF